MKSTLVDSRMAGMEVFYFSTPPNEINMRVSESIRKCTLFIGVGTSTGETRYGGTAFLVGVPGEEHGRNFAYLVTAKHILEQIQREIGNGSFVIRANKTDGTSIEFGARLDHWAFHTDPTVDVAISIFSPPLKLNLDVRFIMIPNFLSEEGIQKHGIGSGDEVYMAGLFTKASGSSQNMPIVRMGSIALMPKEPIIHGDSPIEAYLIESRSIGGLSGSPAFVSATVPLPYLPDPDNPDHTEMLWTSGQTFFLGMVRGHWDVPPNRTFLESEKVNMGISVIVPAKKIKEVLFMPEQVEQRRTIEAKRRAEDESAALDTGFTGNEPEFTKEDFENALKRASRRIQPLPPDEGKSKT
jgi:hypothetical protein